MPSVTVSSLADPSSSFKPGFTRRARISRTVEREASSVSGRVCIGRRMARDELGHAPADCAARERSAQLRKLRHAARKQARLVCPASAPPAALARVGAERREPELVMPASLHQQLEQLAQDEPRLALAAHELGQARVEPHELSQRGRARIAHPRTARRSDGAPGKHGAVSMNPAAFARARHRGVSVVVPRAGARPAVAPRRITTSWPARPRGSHRRTRRVPQARFPAHFDERCGDPVAAQPG